MDVPVISDVHQIEEIEPAAEVLDILQIPAFLCRQTDLLVSAARTGKRSTLKRPVSFARGYASSCRKNKVRGKP